MAQKQHWWTWLSGLFHTRPKAAGRVRPKRRARRTADFADHGTAFGLDMSLTAAEPKATPRQVSRTAGD